MPFKQNRLVVIGEAEIAVFFVGRTLLPVV